MSDKSKVPIVLLCAASGTGLTGVADSLRAFNSQLEVRDLESLVCEMHNGTSMEQIVRRPRPVLYESWRVACTRILNEIVEAEQAKGREKKKGKAKNKADSSPPALVSMHLTWANPDTSEFFSPVDLFKFRRKDCAIVHVVILIDDIYDMFCRLQGNGDLYSDEHMQQHQQMLSRLSHELDESGLQAVAIEMALSELLSWRRAEMIQAENIARSLGAKLTVLGAKHDRRALEILLTKPDAPRIYLSHRITEPRRYKNDSRTKEHPLGTWLPVADEVNTLHVEFTAPDQDLATRGQVLITPTAIDELRFDKADEEGRRNPYLGARWPMPQPAERLLWSNPLPGSEPTASAEHTGIFTGRTGDLLGDYPDFPDAHPVSNSVASSLANKIFFEIAFRDHVIVENTPNLCAYRPFFCRESDAAEADALESGADWSSGVKREIEHWEDSQRLRSGEIPSGTIPRDPDSRRIAFVHTEKEIVGRFRWLQKEPQRARFLNDVRKHLRKSWENSGVPDDEIYTLWSGHVPTKEPTQLGRRPAETVVARKPREVFDAIEPAVQTALHFVFTSLLRPSLEDSDAVDTSPLHLDQVALYAIRESDDGAGLNLERLVSDLRTFFSGVLNAPGVEVVNVIFWRACEECFESFMETELNRYVAESLSLPYCDLKELAGR